MGARSSIVVATTWLIVLGSQSGKAAQTVEPTLPKAADAMGETTCAHADARITPLIVDWTQEQRGDAEAEMSGALAVVAYDCKTTRVLPDCHIEGVYGYVGLPKDEQSVQIRSDDERPASTRRARSSWVSAQGRRTSSAAPSSARSRWRSGRRPRSARPQSSSAPG